MDLAMEGSSKENLKVIINDLVNHLFLPMRLPNCEDENVAQIELRLLEYLLQIASPLLNQCSLTNTEHTFSTWLALQSTPIQLCGTLESSKPGKSACLYVRKQNCTIFFTKLSEVYMRVITFRSSLPNKEITGTEGSLKVTYPETLDVVPMSSLLLSPCFSKQLEHLTLNMCPIAMPMPTTIKAGTLHVEEREPSNPYVISDFLVGMLCPVDPNEYGKMTDMDSIKFQKKLRDQVNWQNCLLPWRRSGLWTSAKVILELSLQEEMKSREEAYLMYKLIILEILSTFAVYYVNLGNAYWDTIAQIMAKLARRAKKITEMKMSESVNINVISLRQQVLDHTWEKLNVLHTVTSEQWRNAVMVSPKNCKEICTVIRSGHDWILDCIHHIPKLTDYLNADQIPNVNPGEVHNLKMIDPVIQTQTVTLVNLISRAQVSSSQQQDVHLNDESTWIYQVEWFARNGLHGGLPSSEIFNLLKSYVRKAFYLYGSTYADPVYVSRLVITVLKFVAVLDKISIAAHPLLKAYTTGIQPEMFHCLLIPEKCEMKLVEELQAYFLERNKNANFQECWLAKSSIGRGDFPVRFAQGNMSMRTLKQQILDQMEKDIKAKKEEIDRVEKECKELQQQIYKTSCTYIWSSYHEKFVHASGCHKCSLESTLKWKRVSVSLYQRPLPPQLDLRDAVVFELLIPQEISVLRESVLILLEDILDNKQTFLPKITGIQIKWMEFKELQIWSKTGHQDFCHLGSETIDTLSTHYGKANPDVLLKGYSEFILENGLGCKHFRTSMVSNNYANPFTMKIQDVSYQSLQFALDPQRPTENEVISKQYVCHQNITLREFKAFGTLRSANLAQIRNLYADIASQLLSLGKEPVLQLIMQTLWELGPRKREIHVDFELAENKQFSMAFLKLLRNSCEENASNWSHPMFLLSLTVITVRILELNECHDVKENAARLLQQIRAVLEKWCIKLEALLVKTADTQNTKMLMDSLSKSAMCTMYTFNVSSAENMPQIFKDPSDVTFYLKALPRLHHLVVRENILRENAPSVFTRNMLRHARHAVPLNVQDYLYKSLLNASFNSGIHFFVCSKWFDTEKVPCTVNSHNSILIIYRFL